MERITPTDITLERLRYAKSVLTLQYVRDMHVLTDLLIRVQVGKQRSARKEDRGLLSAKVVFSNPFTHQ